MPDGLLWAGGVAGSYLYEVSHLYEFLFLQALALPLCYPKNSYYEMLCI